MTPLWPTGIEKKTNLAFVRLKRAIQLSSEPFFFTTKIKRSRYGRNRADRRIEGTPWNSGRPNREEESVVKMADAKGLQNGAGRLLSPPGATELRLRGSSFSFLDLVHAECAVPRPQSPKPNRLVVVVFFVRVCVSSSFSSVAGRTARR